LPNILFFEGPFLLVFFWFFAGWLSENRLSLKLLALFKLIYNEEMLYQVDVGKWLAEDPLLKECFCVCRLPRLDFSWHLALLAGAAVATIRKIFSFADAFPTLFRCKEICEDHGNRCWIVPKLQFVVRALAANSQSCHLYAPAFPFFWIFPAPFHPSPPKRLSPGKQRRWIYLPQSLELF